MADNNWHAIAMVYDAAIGLTVYEDGLPVGNMNAPNYAPFTNSVPLNIGRSGSGRYFNGTIDDVRIYARTLSPTEILDTYRTEFGAVISIAPAVKLQFPTIVGKTYQLESSTDLATWSPLGSSFTATANTSSRYVDAAQNDEFYRLRVIQ
jgi:hypothetical protein